MHRARSSSPSPSLFPRAIIAALRGTCRGCPQVPTRASFGAAQYKPGRTFTLPIPMEADRLAPVVASRDPNWIGPLNGIALALRLPVASTVAISGVSLDPLTLRSQLAGRFRDWIDVRSLERRFDQHGRRRCRSAGAAAARAARAGRRARGRRSRRARALAAALDRRGIAAGACRDVRRARGSCSTRAGNGISRGRWSSPRRPTPASTGARSTLPRRTARCSNSSRKSRAKLPATPARVFMVADAHYFRGRGAYHLYPHNVYFDPWTNTIPSAGRDAIGRLCRRVPPARDPVRRRARECCAGMAAPPHRRGIARRRARRSAVPDPLNGHSLPSSPD